MRLPRKLQIIMVTVQASSSFARPHHPSLLSFFIPPKSLLMSALNWIKKPHLWKKKLNELKTSQHHTSQQQESVTWQDCSTRTWQDPRKEPFQRCPRVTWAVVFLSPFQKILEVYYLLCSSSILFESFFGTSLVFLPASDSFNLVFISIPFHHNY